MCEPCVVWAMHCASHSMCEPCIVWAIQCVKYYTPQWPTNLIQWRVEVLSLQHPMIKEGGGAGRGSDPADLLCLRKIVFVYYLNVRQSRVVGLLSQHSIRAQTCLMSRVMLQSVAVCCNVLQCVAVCCSVLQCVATCCSDTRTRHTWKVKHKQTIDSVTRVWLSIVWHCSHTVTIVTVWSIDRHR